jgi:hypothetical protein
VARNYLAAFLLIGVAVAGCKKKAEPPEPTVNVAEMHARRDSMMKAKATADSIAAARFKSCSDSVTNALKKTAAGRRSLATKRPAGVMVPEILTACGAAPGQLPITTARADTAKKPVTARDTTRKVATPPPAAANATPPAGSASPTMTPQQRQLARADSIRKAREQAKADSLTRATEVARADSISRTKVDSIRNDSLRQVRETEVLRETFAYGGASRDPFASLVGQHTEGPEFGDLQLVAIYQDLRYAGNSIAVVRDKTANKRYSVRVGDRIGQMKIAQIRQRDVVFTIEDLGFERQETLSLRKREEQNP